MNLTLALGWHEQGSFILILVTKHNVEGQITLFKIN